RRVCGCTPASSAATLMMYSARSLDSWLSRFDTSLSLHSEPRARRVLLRLAQLRQQLLLLLGESLWHVDVHRDEQVARALAPRDALAAHTERAATGGPGRDLQRHRPVQRGHLHVGPERGLRVRHRKIQGEVAA